MISLKVLLLLGFLDFIGWYKMGQWRDIVDAMRTCKEAHETVSLMPLRSSYFRKWLIKTGDQFGVMKLKLRPSLLCPVQDA